MRWRGARWSASQDEDDTIPDEFSVEVGTEINLEDAGAFMLKGDTEFLDKVRAALALLPQL